MKTRRIVQIATILSLPGLLFAGCTTSDPGGTVSSDAPPATVVIALSQELNTIDPTAAIDSNSSSAINQVYEGLYRLDANNSPVPAGAAALPEVSADGLTYTISLNQAAKWSDGTPVKAADYEWAWKRAVGLDSAAENEVYYGFVLNASDIIAGNKPVDELGIKALDDYTLEIKLAAPTTFFASLLASVSFFPLNEAYVTSQGDKFGSDSEHAIYNGPFVLADYAGPGVGTDWKYVKNPTYWDAASVKLDSIEVRVIKETSTAVNLYTSGEVDQVAISGAQVQALRNDPGFTAYTTATAAFLGYNFNIPAFANVKVRQAISLVIDRAALVNNVLNDGSALATGLVPAGLSSDQTRGDFATAAGNPLETDVDKAKTLWAEAKQELGIDKLEIDLQTFDSDRMRTVTQYLQNVIQENLVGTTVTITASPVANFLENTKSGSFGIYLVTWGADYADASSLLDLARSNSGSNWGHYSSPEFDAAFAAAQGADAADSAARFDDLLQAHAILLADQGYTPVYFQSSTLLRNPEFKGVVFHSAGSNTEYKTAYIER
ncbi:MAG: peptide ABC transporter substrate-binding protein [Propionibacteriaceae bacterium]|jgi:ABC-type oligopeptide transport system substrate-binding subunit|nr:peptide ABC transporter substrate-binding protein [Propionibacteriaceae bacterium]